MNALAPKQLESEIWFEQAMAALADSGPMGQGSAEYIRRHHIVIGFSRQRNTGASWFDWRRLRRGIFLRADYADQQPDDPQLCALIAHEAKHLEQGMMEALSVRGELVAWQLQYDVLMESGTKLHDHGAWQRLRVLEPDIRADLKCARSLMKQIAGPGYRIGWLPLWPLLAEVIHQLKSLSRRLRYASLYFNSEKTTGGVVMSKKANLSETYKPGETCPHSGQYAIVDEKGIVTDQERTVVCGKPFPPTPKEGQSYVLVDPTQRNAVTQGEDDETKMLTPEYAVDPTGELHKLMPEKGPDRAAATASFVYLLLMLALFCWQLFDIWLGYYYFARLVRYPGVDSLEASSFRLAAYALIGGGLGAVTNGLRSVIVWHCDRYAFGRRYLWKYITGPWLGSVLGLFIYALLRGGFVVLGGDIAAGEVGTTQGVFMFALGALAGYGSRDVLIWLDAQVTRVFKVSPVSEIKVPNLLGRTQKEAEGMLRGAGLIVGQVVEEVQEDSIDEALLGKVTKQKPVAGSSIPRGEAVDITIAVQKEE